MPHSLIDAREPLRRLARERIAHPDLPTVTWRAIWDTAEGIGASAGVLDGAVAVEHPDLVGAKLTVRRYVSATALAPLDVAHATHTVTTLVGQGAARVRGIAPGAHLFVASVVGPDGTADSGDVVAGLRWLATCEPTILVIPLGNAHDDPDITDALAPFAQRDIPIFVAAGNSYPASVQFPARDASAIATGAIDERGELLMSCCREPRLDLVAPGMRIWAAIAADREQPGNGTSTACTLTAGAALLAVSAAGGGRPSRDSIVASVCAPGT